MAQNALKLTSKEAYGLIALLACILHALHISFPLPRACLSKKHKTRDYANDH